MPMQVTTLIYFITYQSVRTTQPPTTTSKFSRTPGCINLKIINCKTEAVNTLCKQATSSLYSDSEGKLSLKSEVLLPLLELITDHAKLCGWEIFDMHISTTGFVKELLGHYGEINL